MSRLVIVVQTGRRAAGRAVLLGDDGTPRLKPLPVLATASDAAALRHGNPDRDWRRPFGDLPTGAYVVVRTLPPANGTHCLGALVLSPTGGNALEALRAGRTCFLVHGGPTDPQGRLRPTFGGLRLVQSRLRRAHARHQRGERGRGSAFVGRSRRDGVRAVGS